MTNFPRLYQATAAHNISSNMSARTEIPSTALNSIACTLTISTSTTIYETSVLSNTMFPYQKVTKCVPSTQKHNQFKFIY